MSKSIYKTICDNISDGIIPPDFSLPEEDPDTPVHWAPGAMDGVCMFHTRHEPLDPAGRRQMIKALKSASDGNYPETEALFAELTREHRAVSIVDEMLDYITDHEAELNAGNIYDFAFSMLVHSTHIECVKIALELQEIFTIIDEDVREIIRRLGLYEEFTLFAIWNMMAWINGNEEIFTLAKKVHGWGRIHAVEFLKPENKEIKHWLLTEGTINEVENAYSALTCWQKSDAESVLFGKPTAAEYKGISGLILALLDEGPVPGISEIENAEQILLRFLEITPEFAPGIQEYEVISAIYDWADNEDEPGNAVLAACGKILFSPDCESAVKDAVEKGEGIRLAYKLGIPYRDRLLELLRQDFDGYYDKILYLMPDPEYIEPTLQIFREKLPLAEMLGDPADIPGIGEEYLKYDQLLTLIMELGDKPLTGMDLMETALRSPIMRDRYWALRNLKSWVREKGLPLADLSPELCAAVSELRQKEIDDKCEAFIGQLLSGQIMFDDEEDFDD